jgi:hypothetical protein
MFLPTAAMCECNLFPVYSQQLPSNAPPPDSLLPPPFQTLCLACILQIYYEFTKPSYADKRIAASFLNRFVTQSMLDTNAACYHDYYTTNEQATYESDCHIAYGKAYAWIDQRVKKAKPECDAYDRAQAELAKAAEEQKDKVASGAQ